jgi:hypothetical protein
MTGGGIGHRQSRAKCVVLPQQKITTSGGRRALAERRRRHHSTKPGIVRDPLYRWIARNRYRLLGKRTTCYLPAPEDSGRFLG